LTKSTSLTGIELVTEGDVDEREQTDALQRLTILDPASKMNETS